MQIDQLKQLIKAKFCELGNEFTKLIKGYHDPAEFKKATGLDFEEMDAERGSDGDHDQYFYRFKIDGVTYEVSGYYTSDDGIYLDYPFEFYEVQLVERTIQVWEPV